MAVSERDVRHVAQLARLGLDPARVEALVHELNGILAHMDALAGAGEGVEENGAGAASALRADSGPQLPWRSHASPSRRTLAMDSSWCRGSRRMTTATAPHDRAC